MLLNLHIHNKLLFKFLRYVRDNFPSLPTFAILPSDDILIQRCKSLGLTEYILRSNINNLCLRCKIRRLLNKEREDTVEVLSKNGFHINTQLHEIYVHDKKVPLTNLEYIVIRYLIQSNNYCTTENLHKYFNLRISKKALTMLISRLRRKIRHNTGYTLIKSRYRKGYYIEA